MAGRPIATVKHSTTERRFALGTRRRVEELTREEMRRELLTSEVTGLPNRRAFEEAGPAPAVAMCDADGLKALNDTYGYAAGDALLAVNALAFKEAGLEAYHVQGDEFLCSGSDIKELQAGLERARRILRNNVITVACRDGGTLRFSGADFSYGTGRDLAEAELRLKKEKAWRKAQGELTRGELRGIKILERPEEAVTNQQLSLYLWPQET